MQVAYTLAAGENEEITSILEQCVTVIDPLLHRPPPSPAAATPANQPTGGKRTPSAPGRDVQYQDLKSRVHNRLFDVIDFAAVVDVGAAVGEV